MSVPPYQSVWMAHWMQSCCESATQSHSHLLIHSEQLSQQEMAANTSNSFERYRGVAAAGTVKISNENLMIDSERTSNEGSEYLPFPMFNLCWGSDNNSALPSEENPLRECNSWPQSISVHSDLLSKSHKLSAKNSIAFSTPHEKYSINEFQSKILPTKEKIGQSSSLLASKEHFTKYQSHSRTSVQEKKADELIRSKKIAFPFLRQNIAPLLLQEPSTSKSQLPVGQNMQSHSGIELLPSEKSHPEVAVSKSLYNGFNSLSRWPYYFHNVEAMKISTTIGSVGNLSGGPPKFSQTTHHFLFTNESDVNLVEGNQMVGNSAVLTKVKGGAFTGSHFFPNSDICSQQEAKMQLQGNVTERKEDVNVRHIKSSVIDLRDESTSETDTMYTDSFKENNNFGVVSSLLSKEAKRDQTLSLSQSTASFREAAGGGLLKDRPDITQRFSALPAETSLMHDKETSMSRTQSLGVEHLIPSTDQSTDTKSIASMGGAPIQMPGCRWVKRLRLTFPGSLVRGTKISEIEEASYSRKFDKDVSKIPKCSITSPEPVINSNRGKELTSLDSTAVLLKEGESFSTDFASESQNITLSQRWIQRWCHNKGLSPQQKPKAVVICEPQSSNAALNELQKRHLPSIAAMALMGKARNGFHPCEFRKRGSCVIWNASEC